MIILKEGDLVYSFASQEFFILMKVHGKMCFTLYAMNGRLVETIDVTLTHIEMLPKDYREKIFIPLWAID